MVQVVIKAKTGVLGTKLLHFAAHNTIKEFIFNNNINEIIEIDVLEFQKIMKIRHESINRIADKKLNRTALGVEIDNCITYQFLVPKDKNARNEQFKPDNYITHNLFSSGYREGNKVYFKINKDVFQNHILNIKENYTAIPLTYIANSKTNYSTRMYEYFKSHLYCNGKTKTNKFKYNKTFSLHNLEEIFGINLSASYFAKADDLRKRVLEPALKELAKTIIDVKYEFKKTGKKITHITFWAKLNTNKLKEIKNEGKEKDIEMTQEEINAILKAFDEA